MPARSNRFWSAIVCAGTMFGFILSGCSGKKFTFAEVEGKVTLGRKPLVGVKVSFYPDSESTEQQPYATGLTDSSGTYTLTLSDGRAGALVGKNRVVVQWPFQERINGQQPPPLGPPIPILYTVADQTPLVVEVKEGARQTINVELP